MLLDFADVVRRFDDVTANHPPWPIPPRPLKCTIRDAKEHIHAH